MIWSVYSLLQVQLTILRLQSHLRRAWLGSHCHQLLDPFTVPAWLYKTAWAFNRLAADMCIPTGAGLRHRLRVLMCPTRAAVPAAPVADPDKVADVEMAGNHEGRGSCAGGLGCLAQLFVGVVLVFLMRVPGSPLTEWVDGSMLELMRKDAESQVLAVGIMLLLLSLSTALMWMLLAHVIKVQKWRACRISWFFA